MFFDRQVNSPLMAVFAVNQLAKLVLQTAQANIDQALTAETGGNFNSRVIGGDASLPSTYVGGSGPFVFVAISGSQNIAQASGYAASLLDPGGNPRGDPSNEYCRVAANVIYNNMAGLLAPGGREVVIAGHSLGGAIAYYLARQITRADFAMPKVLTFGAPRPGGRFVSDTFPPRFLGRYFMSNDAVVLIPPRRIETWSVLGGWTYPNIYNMASYRHPAGGLEIDSTGLQINEREVPAFANASPARDIGQWLLSQYQTSNPHSLSNYTSKLLIYLGSHPPADNLPTFGSKEEARGDVTQGHFNRIRQEQASAIVNLANRQGASNPLVPLAYEFVAKKSGPLWVVEWQGSQVTVAPTKKRARALANSANEFLRRLQVQGSVNSAAILQQMLQYLAAAASPDLGFVPNMLVPDQAAAPVV